MYCFILIYATNNSKEQGWLHGKENIFFLSNISKGTAFLLQGMFETDLVVKGITIKNSHNQKLMLYKQKRYNLKCESTTYRHKQGI